MKAKQLAPLAIALLCATAGAQQMYKYVAPDGTVSYSDKPPPSTATKVEKKTMAGGGSSLDDLPYELAQAAKNSPVTLYTSQGCTPCDQGRKLLNDRGIPFVEKTITTAEDNAQFTKLAGTSTVPVLMVGRTKQAGFSVEQWNMALTAANYPTSNHMPKSHRNPAPEALVAPAPKVEAKPVEQAPAPAPAPTQEPGAQPGFHF
ncbi:MAG TPA: glutaredoxin family protein [Burkholderiaceae bacterium]